MIAHLKICSYGPLLKIVSKIYYIIPVKKSGWTKYDLTTTGEFTIFGCVLRLMIVSNIRFLRQVNWLN